VQLDRGDLRGIGAVDVGDGFELPDGEAAVRALLERSNRYRDLAPEALRARQTQTRIGLLLPDLSHVRGQVEGRGAISSR
jgi:hypothetical protein